MTEAELDKTQELIEQIRQILAGHDPTIQGSVLADLLAILLAGHVAGNQTAKLREDLLRIHVRTVRKLIPINHEMIHGHSP